MNTLLEPFGYGFFRHALMVSVLAGGLCGLVGVYVVLRGMSYIGHGLSHAVFGGAVAGVAFLGSGAGASLGAGFYPGAALFGVGAALLINRIARRRTIGADAAIGVVTSAAFAFGIAIISTQDTFRTNTEALLFGNVLGVTMTDVYVVAAVAVTVTIAVFLWYRQLLFATFDPEVAEVSGVSTNRTDVILALMLAATIIATMNVVGVMLIAAVLVIPPVIARLLTDSFHRMLWISVGVGAALGFVGVYLSYYLDVSSGATVVITGAALFAVVYAWSAVKGRRAMVDALDAHQ
jgi:manganese/iron transport system permease protein/iron/zinc/copper transport system permease protein